MAIQQVKFVRMFGLDSMGTIEREWISRLVPADEVTLASVKTKDGSDRIFMDPLTEHPVVFTSGLFLSESCMSVAPYRLPAGTSPLAEVIFNPGMPVWVRTESGELHLVPVASAGELITCPLVQKDSFANFLGNALRTLLHEVTSPTPRRRDPGEFNLPAKFTDLINKASNKPKTLSRAKLEKALS